MIYVGIFQHKKIITKTFDSGCPKRIGLNFLCCMCL